jgi:hypothetical protein
MVRRRLRSRGGGVSSGWSMRWDGSQPPIRPAGQPPAPLMHRPMMRPTQQGQIDQVGGAAIQPMLNVVGFTPGKRPLAVGEHTAAVTHSQGKALGGLDHPGAAAHVQGLAGGSTQDRGQHGAGRPQLSFQGWVTAGAVPATGMVVAAGIAVAVVAAGIIVIVVVLAAGLLVGGVAGDQDSGQRPITSQPPARLRTQRPAVGHPTHRPRTALQAGQVDGDQQLGPHPTRLGQPPPLKLAASQLGQGIRPPLPPLRSSAALWGRARGSRAARRVWPASASSRPSTATILSRVGDSHRPRC